ncbi:MAG TPA: hypothetical protein VGB37_15990 [Candidatus Lokiarchaeia archaeon]
MILIDKYDDSIKRHWKTILNNYDILVTVNFLKDPSLQKNCNKKNSRKTIFRGWEIVLTN